LTAIDAISRRVASLNVLYVGILTPSKLYGIDKTETSSGVIITQMKVGDGEIKISSLGKCKSCEGAFSRDSLHTFKAAHSISTSYKKLIERILLVA
jgi:hypothetical protein